MPGARESVARLSRPDRKRNLQFTEASVEAELRKLAEERGSEKPVLINASRAH